ncbi:MAG: metallophosphoesterase [Lachnospiraceae bacterium]|nr:metallophosphoesterase [Lachnospiraceae bacterium]
MSVITIAHLSDIHYGPNENSQVSTMLREKGVFVEKLLPVCLENLKIRKPDIILITGDITHDGSPEDYQYLKDTFSEALPDTPVFCTIGNHDIRSSFRSGFLNENASDTPYYASTIVKGYQFISLDSSYENGLLGIFTDEALDFLEEKLADPEVKGNFLLMHHPIMESARHLRFLMNDRLETMLKSGKITGIFNGHVHGCYTSTVHGTPQFTAESLKTDFDILHDRLSYNDRAGYQIVTFRENGDWQTERFILNPKTHIFFERMYKK